MTRPRLSIQDVLKLIAKHKIDRNKYPVVMVGIRGYYLDSMGRPKMNDRGIYDDACFIVTPDEMRAYNFNTDPSRYRKGKGKGAGKGMANLKPGVWYYRKGLHKGYQAFVQADQVTVIRDGIDGDYEDTGWFGINLHRGGFNSTSSLGCQTWPAGQWDEAKKFTYSALDRESQTIFPYILIEETSLRYSRA